MKRCCQANDWQGFFIQVQLTFLFNKFIYVKFRAEPSHSGRKSGQFSTITRLCFHLAMSRQGSISVQLVLDGDNYEPDAGPCPEYLFAKGLTIYGGSTKRVS